MLLFAEFYSLNFEGGTLEVTKGLRLMKNGKWIHEE
jgi:hypothetical protein